MHIIVMAVGEDRPGLTQALADAIVAAEGNWLESHFARLGGQYVGSVLVELPAHALPALEQAASGMSESGFHITIEPANESAADQGQLLGFEIVGKDRPGIVREVSAALARLGVGIVKLVTGTEEGAMFGGTVFRARAQVLVPETMSFDTVRAALEDISGEIMVDFEDETA